MKIYLIKLKGEDTCWQAFEFLGNETVAYRTKSLALAAAASMSRAHGVSYEVVAFQPVNDEPSKEQ